MNYGNDLIIIYLYDNELAQDSITQNIHVLFGLSTYVIWYTTSSIFDLNTPPKRIPRIIYQHDFLCLCLHMSPSQANFVVDRLKLH
jgi:hypothetical protein